MFFNRPPRVALLCVGLWLTQWLLFGLMYRDLGPPEGFTGWDIAWLATSLTLGAMLMMQLPRALRWLPRRVRRPSAQVRAERARIARDLHDRLGSQLVNAMALLDASHPSQRTAQQMLGLSILDLRLIVDAMAMDEEPLPQCLARLRHRFQPALERRGIRIVWAMPEAEGLDWPVGDVAADITAVVQEALSNVLQHARASTVRVAVQAPAGPGGAWSFTVHDDGALRAAAATGPPGQGVLGMHQRAARAGGRLQWHVCAGGGVQVRLEVPAMPRSAPL